MGEFVYLCVCACARKGAGQHVGLYCDVDFKRCERMQSFVVSKGFNAASFSSVRFKELQKKHREN